MTIRIYIPILSSFVSFGVFRGKKTKRTQTQRTCRVVAQRRRMYKRTQFEISQNNHICL
jgi:hypothetical protein